MFNPEGRRQRGLAVYKEMGWGENESVKALDEDLWQFITDIGFGEVWSRPGLSLRERELVVIGALMAVKADGIASHMKRAHHLGITHEEIKEVILQLTIYLGMPKGLFAMKKLKEIMAAAGDQAPASK
jgi:4-carboxymuconolactone decarboxylase